MLPSSFAQPILHTLVQCRNRGSDNALNIRYAFCTNRAFYSVSSWSCIRPSFSSATLRVFARVIVRKHCTRHTTLHHSVPQLARRASRTTPTHIHRKHNTASTATNSLSIHPKKTHTNNNLTIKTKPKTHHPVNPSRRISRRLLTHLTRRHPIPGHTTLLPTHHEPTTEPGPKPILCNVHSLRNHLRHSTHNVRLLPMEKTQHPTLNTQHQRSSSQRTRGADCF